MMIGKVVGKLWSTRKNEKLNGQKFLVIKFLKENNKLLEGYFVAADIVGAGTGDMVLVLRGGSARKAIGDDSVPIDAAIVGIIDSLEVDYE